MEALSQKHLRSFYPTLVTVADRLRRRWEKAAESGEVRDLPDELKRFTVDVTTQLAFGYDINTLEQGDDVIQRKLELLFPALNRRIFSVIPWWRIFQLPSDRRVSRVTRELLEWLTGLVEKARARLAENAELGRHPANFLEAMVAATDDDGRPFTNEVILGNAMTMLLAGEDTTAYSLAWAVHHLIDAPHEVKTLQREIDQVLDGQLIPGDMEKANRLVYAGAVANEGMRLRPVAPLIFLEAIDDTTVADIDLPKGTQVALLVRAPAVNERHFASPDQFLPMRWIEPESVETHDASAHQPFGSGPRICPGRSLALLEMKLVLGTLYRNFEVERVGDVRDVREVFAFTMTPVGMNVRLRKRASQR